jgi:hypothetical protein
MDIKLIAKLPVVKTQAERLRVPPARYLSFLWGDVVDELDTRRSAIVCSALPLSAC